ncbi:MAG: ribosome recycling factor [Candidatus Kaiserbacteria bacterium]|nr:ribosome recycling factor [Candidatus Kaiserbacteria bacterium]MCB9816134.1 ribosome recycling factor [Candidatus Nomurabacteria bacterium]
MDSDSKKRLEEAKDWLQKEYAGIRTGQSSPALLDGVRVESYGSLMPLNQVGSVGIEDARTLRVSPWDATQVTAIETAIRDADLGVSVVTDSSGLRVIFPELTAERREQLLKLAKSKLEDARVTVRAIRDDFMKAIDKSHKDGDISDDERFAKKEAVQKAIDATNKDLEALAAQKETELKK